MTFPTGCRAPNRKWSCHEMKVKLTAAQRKAGVDLRDLDLRGVVGMTPAQINKKIEKLYAANGVITEQVPRGGRAAATSKKPKASKSSPKQFRGAHVVRGLGMNPDAIDTLVDRHAYGEFSDAADGDAYLVLEDNALRGGCFMEPRLFASEEHAIRYARAMSNGNVDHRVLRVAGQTLVIGTDNKL